MEKTLVESDFGTTFITDCMEQLQGRAGKRQVTIRHETALTVGVLPGGGGTLVFSTSPN